MNWSESTGVIKRIFYTYIYKYVSYHIYTCITKHIFNITICIVRGSFACIIYILLLQLSCWEETFRNTLREVFQNTFWNTTPEALPEHWNMRAKRSAEQQRSEHDVFNAIRKYFCTRMLVSSGQFLSWEICKSVPNK